MVFAFTTKDISVGHAARSSPAPSARLLEGGRTGRDGDEREGLGMDEAKALKDALNVFDSRFVLQRADNGDSTGQGVPF